MEFWTYYRVLRKRARTMLFVVLAGLIVGVIAAWPWSQQHVASVTLTTSPAEEGRFVLVLVGDQAQPLPDTTKSLALELIRSRTVAERVVQQLNLDRTPQALRSRLRVTRREGDLINLSVRDRNPSTAVLLANTFAEVAVSYNQEVNRREAGLARAFIERELEDTRLRLRRAENALDEFKDKHGIVVPSTHINAELATFVDLTAQQRSTVVAEREVAARVAALRRRLKEFAPTKVDHEVTENPVAQRLRGDLVSLEVQLAIAQATFTKDHPNVLSLDQKITALKDALAREVQKVVSTEFIQVNPIHENLVRALIDAEVLRVALQARQAALTSMLPEEQRKLPALNTLSRDFARLSRQVAVLETASATLEIRLNEFRIREQAAMNRNLIYIVDPATTAQPVKRSRVLPRILLAAMLGLAGGMGFVLFQYFIDNTLKTAKEAERLLGLPVLSSIPKHNPPFEEAYRLLKTNMGLHLANHGPRAIMFTSAKPGSGTSTVVFHLAETIARGGKRVIVVDADLRHPSAHRLFGVSGEYGLVDVLRGAVGAREALQVSALERVQVLPAGAWTGELADLFASPSMTRMLEELKQHADVVLIDTPPALSFAESRALASVVDGVVFVVAAGQALRGVEQEAKQQLERAQARLLGMVVNKVIPEEDDGYYFYEKYNSRAEKPKPKPLPATATATFLLIILLAGADSVLSRYSVSMPGWLGQSSDVVKSWVAKRF